MKSLTYILPFLFLLSACSNAPSHIVVAPDFIQTTQQPISVSALSFNVEDNRASKHLVQILKKDQAANLFNSQLPLDAIVETAVKKAFKAKNIQVVDQATQSISVAINEALINVDQSAFKYKANNRLFIKVTVDSPKGTLTKDYNYKGTSEGPLKADIAVLGRDFNQALTQVLNQVLTDQELINFINQ